MEYITKVIPTFTKLVSGLQSYFNPKQSGFASRMINAGIVLFIYIISNFIWTLLDNILFFVLFYKTVNYLHSMKQNTTICDASGVTPILEGWLVYGALSLFFNVLYYLTSFIGFGFILIPIKLMVGYKLLNDESLFGWIFNSQKKYIKQIKRVLMQYLFM